MSEELLVIGGPHNGQMLPREENETTITKMVTMSDPENPLATPVAIPTIYVARYVLGQSPDGSQIKRAVWTHESIQSPIQLMQGLAQVLIATWLEDGGEVVKAEELVDIAKHTPKMVSGGNGSGAQNMGQEPPTTASGLYLPG